MILLNDIPEEISNLLAEISAEIRPTEKENAKIRAIVTKLSEVITSSKKPSRVQIDFVEAEGSTGIKQTSLRNAADIDLFIALNPAIFEVQQFNERSYFNIRALAGAHPIFAYLVFLYLSQPGKISRSNR